MPHKRILLIDDEVTFTRVLKAYLQEAGPYDVTVANSGLDGLAAAKASTPDMILLDIIMPDMDGSEVAAQLKEDPKLEAVPVIFLTAVVSREEAKTRSGVIGGQFFIAKPVAARDILSHIERYLAQHAGVPAHPETLNGGG